MKWANLQYLLTFLISFSCPSSWAGPTAANSVQGARYMSARGAALGGALLPYADDGASALFVNPAGIAGFKEIQVEPMNLQGQFNSGFMSLLSGESTKAASLSSYKGRLQGNPGTRVGLSGAYAPSISFPGFAVGVLAENRMLGEYTSATDQITYRSRYQLVPAIGTGFSLARGIVRVGYSLQWVQKSAGVVTVSAANAKGYNQGLEEGRAFSHTLGFTLTLPYRYLPAFNLVVRNIGNARYKAGKFLSLSTNGSGTLPEDQMTMDASLSFQPKIGNGSYMNFVLQNTDIMNRSKISILGRVSLGIEMVAKEWLFFRAGWGNGYPAFGFGIKTKKADLSFSYFGEELGGAYHSLKDTRYMFQYQMRVF